MSRLPTSIFFRKKCINIHVLLFARFIIILYLFGRRLKKSCEQLLNSIYCLHFWYDKNIILLAVISTDTEIKRDW